MIFMNVRLLKNQSNAASREVSNPSSSTKPGSAEHVIASRPSLASRVVQLLFQRGRRTAEQEPKSWPGCSKPLAAPMPAVVKYQSTTSISIPNSLSSSTLQSTSSLQSAWAAAKRTSARRVRYEPDNDDCSSKPSWRQRQAYCVNCEHLFFASLSTSAGRFCSLDCKTNFEYVSHLQEVTMLGLQTASGSASSDDDYDSLCDDGAQWI
ncbi:hypothetical protein PRIC2_009431 [Phytophthora ramorum]